MIKTLLRLGAVFFMVGARGSANGSAATSAATPPRRGSAVGRHTTPTSSVRRTQEMRSKRQALGVSGPISMRDLVARSRSRKVVDNAPFGYLDKREGDNEKKLPVFLYLEHHPRTEVRRGGTKFWCTEIQQWWRKNGVRFGAASEWASVEPRSLVKVLAAMHDDKSVRAYYGLSREGEGSDTVWVVSVAPVKANASRPHSVPAGWAEEYHENGTWGFRRTHSGVPTSVIMSNPTPEGIFSLSSVCIRGRDVTERDPFKNLQGPTKESADLQKVLQVIAGVCPCEGVREGSLPGDLRGRFGSYVTRAVRGRSAGHAHELLALGVIHGFQGEATSTLHAVDGGEGQEHVLWSTKCICFEKAVIKTPVLCAACCQSRASYVRWSKQQDQPYKPNAPNPTLSTPIKMEKLDDLAIRDKSWRKSFHQHRLAKCREDDIFIKADCPQGEKIQQVLQHPDVAREFSKLKPESLARAVLEDNLEWNRSNGSSKGWRYNPQVLRWAVYVLNRCGSAAYAVIREVLHLPHPSHARKIKREAAPRTVHVQEHNIKAYGKLAAKDDLGRFDLAGFLVWDLMHLRSDGFTVEPNGGPITGCVDSSSFENPVWALQGMDENIGLEEALERTAATQYLEVFWVSIGDPSYKFVVYREAVRSLNSQVIMDMVDVCCTALSRAHADKAFDVVATICDGAAEHRTFQKDSATEAFSRWAKEGDEFEQRFKDFPVAFQHPHHGHPIFNLSDPPHLWKKLVNALWYSDLPWKSRNLARVWCDPETGEYDLVEFSLKTLERVWYNEERGGGKFSLAEEAAQLTKYTKVNVQQFDRDSYNCMSVPLAVKNLSATAVRMCNDANAKLIAARQKPNPSIACYAEMAKEVNDFVDIMNGAYNRNSVEVKNRVDVWKSQISSAESPQIGRLLEILQWFDGWKDDLRLFDGGETNIEDFFITRETWFDMQLTILGLVAMTRYIFEDQGWGQEGGRRRHLFLRDFNQDHVEHRFGHIRANQGCGRNPNKQAAYEAGQKADAVRNAAV